MRGGQRGIRTKGAWLIAAPFLLFARPAPGSLVLGAALAGLGLALRGWSAGTIHKDEALTTSGPYGFTRNPLYVGSFLIGTGLGIAGGHWVWLVLVLCFFFVAYGGAMADETERLTQLFGQRYVEYVAHVPTWVPRLRPYRGSAADSAPRFRWSQYARNREWEALLGVVASFTVLVLKIRLGR